MAPPFRPFQKGEFVQNPDGTQSTERTITWQLPDGRWVNTPTLFMTPNGVLDLSTPDKEEQARAAAMVLMRHGTQFPIFQSDTEAGRAAALRSSGGGAFQGAPGAPPKVPPSLGMSQQGLRHLPPPLPRPRPSPLVEALMPRNPRGR